MNPKGKKKKFSVAHAKTLADPGGQIPYPGCAKTLADPGGQIPYPGCSCNRTLLKWSPSLILWQTPQIWPYLGADLRYSDHWYHPYLILAADTIPT
jgi:hypothetical protein